MTADTKAQMTADTKAQMTADKTSQDGKYLYKDLTYKIRGAFYEVYNTLGPGFKEEVYHRALAKEFQLNEVPCREKVRLSVHYKGETVGIYEPDFIVDDKVIVEIKSLINMPSVFETQLFYYLKGTDYRLGFLVNFGATTLDIRRRVFDTARISGRPGRHQRSSACNQRSSASSNDE